MGCIHVMMYVCMHAVLIYTHRSHRFVHIDIYARSLRHVWSELVFVHTSFQIHVSGDERNRMALEANTLAAVQSSQSRIAIRESCTRICDGILVVNDFLRIIQDADVMQKLFSHLSWSTLGIETINSRNL